MNNRAGARWTILFTAIFIETLASAQAQKAQDHVAAALAKSFVKTCVLAVPHLDAVAIRARVEGWKQIEGPAHEDVFHSTSEPTRSSWATLGVDELPIAVTIAKKGDTRVKSMTVTCAVQNPDASASDVGKALADLLPLPPPERRLADGDNDVTAWDFFYGDRHVGIALVADKTAKSGVILNAVITQNTP